MGAVVERGGVREGGGGSGDLDGVDTGTDIDTPEVSFPGKPALLLGPRGVKRSCRMLRGESMDCASTTRPCAAAKALPDCGETIFPVGEVDPLPRTPAEEFPPSLRELSNRESPVSRLLRGGMIPSPSAAMREFSMQWTIQAWTCGNTRKQDAGVCVCVCCVCTEGGGETERKSRQHGQQCRQS